MQCKRTEVGDRVFQPPVLGLYAGSVATRSLSAGWLSGPWGGKEPRVRCGGQRAEQAGLQQWGTAEEVISYWGGGEVRGEKDGAGLVVVLNKKGQTTNGLIKSQVL